MGHVSDDVDGTGSGERAGVQGDPQFLTCTHVLFGDLNVEDVTFGIQGLNGQAQRTHFLDEDAERFGNTRLRNVFTLDDRFVNLDAPRSVVRLDGQEFLQRVGGAVSLKSPHFHLAETLTTELGFTTQGLLRNHRVGAC